MINGNDTSTITLYVCGWNGKDTNDGLSQYSPLKTIQAAVNKLPKFNIGQRTIDVAPGNYDEVVKIEDFVGARIRISGDRNSTVVKGLEFDDCDNVQVKEIKLSNKQGTGLSFTDCNRVDTYRVTAEGKDAGVEFERCLYAHMGNSNITGNYYGIVVSSSNPHIETTTINSQKVGISANESFVCSRSNTISAPEQYYSGRSQIFK